MSILGVNGFNAYGANKTMNKASTQAAEKENQAVKEEGAEQAEANKKQDTLVTGNSANSVTYSRPNTQKMNANQLMALEQQRTDSFTKMLQGMVVRQGQKANLSIMGMDLFVTPEQSADAASAIAPGGEYSVDAVASRIMDMAKALSGGDESKISLLRNAVEKGFKAAGVDFGQKLPGICNDTHTEVMKRFDEWQTEAEQASQEKGTTVDDE